MENILGSGLAATQKEKMGKARLSQKGQAATQKGRKGKEGAGGKSRRDPTQEERMGRLIIIIVFQN